MEWIIQKKGAITKSGEDPGYRGQLCVNVDGKTLTPCWRYRQNGVF